MKHPIETSLPNVELSEATLEHCCIVPKSELKKECGFDFRPLTTEEKKEFKQLSPKPKKMAPVFDP